MLSSLVLAALLGSGQDAEARVAALVSQMTLEEKIGMLGGVDGFYTKPIPRLGLGRLRMSDGPAGVRNDNLACAMPAPLLLAATWDPAMAKLYGETLGKESRARGVHVLLAPGVNLYRVPVNGRNFEYMGEDPWLASMMVDPLVHGIQGEGVVGCVKHYAANNQEFERLTISSEVDERTLRELELRPFESAIRAGVGSVMASYNRLNGTHTTQHRWLLTDVLKREWGFKGFVVSDWGATHSDTPLELASNGLDLEMPEGYKLNAKELVPLVEAGKLDVAQIDDMVARILRPSMQLGQFDRPQSNGAPLDDPRNAAASLAIARRGLVLLRNEGDLLPLDPTKVEKVALLGPAADPMPTGGGGSSYTTPFRSVSVLEGLERALGKDRVVFESGVRRTPVDLFDKAEFVGPLQGEYFLGRRLEGQPAFRRADAKLNFNWRGGAAWPGGPENNFSVRWTGQIRPKESGKYDLVASTDDGVRVWIDGKLAIDFWADRGEAESQASIDLEAGRTYDLKVEYYEALGEAVMRLGWHKPQQDHLARVRQAAAAADVAVVCVGFGPSLEGEGGDRTWALPEEQVRVIETAKAANPNTVVVLFAGGGVDPRGWLDGVRGLVHALYPGQEGGTALAELLTGKLNPSGKLPFSWTRTWEAHPGTSSYPGANGQVFYTEGIFMGYRGLDRDGIEPLFPFGHGLAYTRYEYSGLRVRRSGQDWVVSFQVRNSGSRTGTEVAQVYVAPKESPAPRPVQELKGSAVVTLGPGQSRRVSVTLSPDAFRFWHPDTKAWTTDSGTTEVRVGASSRDIRLRREVEVR